MFKKVFVYTASAIAVVGLILSLQTHAKPKVDPPFPMTEIKTFAEVYGQIKANYYEDSDDVKLIQDAMKGMVSGLDPHSEYMNKDDFKSLLEQTTGQFGGLGIEIVKDDDYIKIVTPIEDTPAFRAGIQPGDLIIKIDGESTRGMSTYDAVKHMKGDPRTSVTLTILRKDEFNPFDVKITREIINIRTVKSKLLGDDLAYVRVSSFKEKTLNDFVTQLKSLIKQNKKPLKGIVLDLRNNGGGLLNSAVGLTAVFIPQDAVVVSTKGRNGIQQSVLKANKSDYIQGYGFFSSDPLANLPPELKSIPITILMNSGSASASEIVTGALQDYGRAVVVGIQSFGKGSVQTMLPLSDGGGIKLTVALYYTPKDRSIQARGIIPDVEIKTEDDLYEIREADFKNHLSNPKGEPEVKGSLNKTKANDSKKTEVKKDTKVEEDQAAKEEKKKKIKEKLLKESSYNYMPDPETDIQLKKAIEITKNHSVWETSLGNYIKNETEIVKEEKKAKK